MKKITLRIVFLLAVLLDKIDKSTVATDLYMIKVISENQVKTIKVMKE